MSVLCDEVRPCPVALHLGGSDAEPRGPDQLLLDSRLNARQPVCLENWAKARASGATEPDGAASRRIGQIEQAIREEEEDDRVLKEYGDLQVCLKRIVELKDLS